MRRLGFIVIQIVEGARSCIRMFTRRIGPVNVTACGNLTSAAPAVDRVSIAYTPTVKLTRTITAPAPQA